MKQSFVKTIEGHEIEFVRLMYPLRYSIFIRVANSNPLMLAFKKNSEGSWVIDQPNELPEWVNEISLPMQHVIEENEADASNE